MDQALVQGIPEEDKRTVQREQARRVLRGEEQIYVGSDVEYDD